MEWGKGYQRFFVFIIRDEVMVVNEERQERGAKKAKEQKRKKKKKMSHQCPPWQHVVDHENIGELLQK